jgi:lon-related putative ATP-dependent protease
MHTAKNIRKRNLTMAKRTQRSEKTKRTSLRQHPLRLAVEDLRWRWSNADIPITSTDHAAPVGDIIGQERALKSIRIGLEMKHFGYNIFITGLSGTGRTTTIKRILHEFEHNHQHLEDLCYVYNFHDTDCPTMLRFPVGQGKQFEKDMQAFVDELRKVIPAILEGKRFQDKRKDTIEHFQNRQRSIMRDFEKKVREKGFELIQVQVGSMVRPEIAPVIDGQPVALEQLEASVKEGKISAEKQKEFQEGYSSLAAHMETVFREMKNIERKAREALEKLDEQIILPVVKDIISEIAARYDNEKVSKYLNDVCQSVMSNLGRFRREEQQQQPSVQLPFLAQQQDDSFLEYKVNVIVDNSEQKNKPVVIETNPKYRNLFGTIDRTFDTRGMWRTDFTQIKAGSILKANGGYLVLNALDTLIEPGVWQDLKRTLRTGLVDIQSFESLFFASSGLKPEPIAINLKVIMIGEALLYHLLYDRDEDFKKIFKIRADFDVEMERSPEHIENYSAFIKMICDEDGLMSFDRTAIGEVVEFGVRLSGRKKKLSTRFNAIADVIREANYWAKKEEAERVTDRHVERAIEERIDRVRLVESKIQELINDGTIMIDTEGEAIGQVNGLAVYDLGEHVFGKPTRITAKTSIGKGNILNIEREADLSGKVHRKGVAILTGFIHWMFSQDKPLAFNASICFEQSYSGVDGDSASSTEIYAILSSLADLPLKQGIAVTGSVNQKGEIQPIGGVNVKIEGFYDVCKAKGLTGEQGVIIPHQNVKDLMLRKDVIEAAEQGKFHVFAIHTVDEGIELLTGVKAGKRLKKTGKFEASSVFGRVDAKLFEYTKRARGAMRRGGNNS